MATVHLLGQQATRPLYHQLASTVPASRMAWPGVDVAFRSFSSSRSHASQVSSLKRRFQNQMNRQTQAKPGGNTGASGSERDALALDQLTRNLSIGTYVSPPFTRFPLSFNFAWTLTKRRFLDYLAVFFFSWSSKPKFLKSAAWKPKRSTIVTQAKALHRTMGEALAAGDKATLRETCIPALATKLVGVIDARQRGRRGIRKSWELVRYNQTWRYPRLADHKMRLTAHPALKNLPAVYQAVVTIASRQRLVEYDDSRGGKVVPGSEKEVDLVEHVVLIATVNSATSEQSEWKIWGTIKETTPESLQYEEQTMAQASNLPMS